MPTSTAPRLPPAAKTNAVFVRAIPTSLTLNCVDSREHLQDETAGGDDREPARRAKNDPKKNSTSVTQTRRCFLINEVDARPSRSSRILQQTLNGFPAHLVHVDHLDGRFPVPHGYAEPEPEAREWMHLFLPRIPGVRPRASGSTRHIPLLLLRCLRRSEGFTDNEMMTITLCGPHTGSFRALSGTATDAPRDEVLGKHSKRCRN